MAAFGEREGGTRSRWHRAMTEKPFDDSRFAAHRMFKRLLKIIVEGSLAESGAVQMYHIHHRALIFR
jgi:hypothetical protein